MRRLSALLLAGALGWSCGGLAGPEDPIEPVGRGAATESWSICSDSAVLPKQLALVAARISARVEEQDADVQVNVVSQDEGSAEFLLASTAEVLAQLRSALAARRVPHRRVAFQWRSASAAAAAIASADCRGVVVLVEMSVGGS